MNENKRKGATNKRKGHQAERDYCNIFKELGFSFCTTARLGSRLYDNAKIDLINLPFNVQIKAGIQKSMNPGRELFSMSGMIKALFPPDDSIHSKPCFLIHKKQIGRGVKKLPEHEVVFMSQKQFQYYQELSNNTIDILFKKEFKFELNSEFKSIVAITFETFKEEIIKKFFIDGSDNNTTTED